MRRFFRTLILTIVIFVGGWLLYHRNQINSISDAWMLASSQLGMRMENLPSPLQLVQTADVYPDSAPYAQPNPTYGEPARQFGFSPNFAAVPIRTEPATNQFRLPAAETFPDTADAPIIRIASFKLDAKIPGGKPQLTADICRQFDIIAIQNVSQLSMSRLVAELNSLGHSYRFVDRAGSKQETAIVFNQQVVALEQQHWYTVNDPENLFQHKPLVVWFRARNVPDNLAFTFSLANLQINPRQADQEIAWLGELFRAIRSDGRDEDDIILAGDFHSSDAQIEHARPIAMLQSAIIDTATNTRNDAQLDNIIFDGTATVEFSGISGTFDFMKRYNLTLDEAMNVSMRMPVWADFSALEGHSPGRAIERYNAVGFTR